MGRIYRREMEDDAPDTPRRLSSSGLRSASVMLYNGVSNRARGWKSKKPGDMVDPDEDLSRWPSIKKFDGAARSYFGWDYLGQDPDLWYRNGNCYVHLYEKGQSQQGPAFRIPFSCLIDAQCQPLIEKFVDRSVSEEEAYQNGRVDLYIPAPLTAGRLQKWQYHIASRNFFAWTLCRSMVGDQLGNALIALVHSMEEFREPGVDNLQDLYNYLDEEGYLDMRDQPDHALAILHLAEAFKIRALYLHAFAHCVGMCERLYKHSEYSRISLASRKLIRHARVELDFRLSRAGSMLSDLLQEELSEAHLGLSAGVRTHLDRFRAYIQGFYVSTFGSFPPAPSGNKWNTIFRPEVYRLMQADFAALYEYLVDESFTTADNSPLVAQGGLCTLQMVHEFDLRHKFEPLEHPLPLLPDPVKSQESRGKRSMSWFRGGGSFRESKMRPDYRLVAHAALTRATNQSKTHLLENKLVVAYRLFEEDSIFLQQKAGSGVSPGDARKVRWLFIYAMYQTLLSCAEIPSEGGDSLANVSYHLGISANTTPPWEGECCCLPFPGSDNREGGKPGMRPGERGRTVSAVPLLSPIISPPRDQRTSGSIELKPDIDYFALTHPEDTSPTRGRSESIRSDRAAPPSRTQSLTRAISLRRPLSLFRSSTQRPATSGSASPRRKGSLSGGTRLIYHEIIVRGYGNGTNDVRDVSTADRVEVEADVVPDTPSLGLDSPGLSVVTNLTAGRSASMSSDTSRGSAMSSSASSSSSGRSDDWTTPTSPISSTGKSNTWQSTSTPSSHATPPPSKHHHHHYMGGRPTYADQKYDMQTVPSRRTSTRTSIRSMYSSDDMLAAASVAEPPPVPRRSSKRLVRAEPSRWSMVDMFGPKGDGDRMEGCGDYLEPGLQPSPLRIHKKDPTTPTRMTDCPFTPIRLQVDDADDVFRDLSDWEIMVSGGGDGVGGGGGGTEISPPCTWEQFHDLGGLQPVHLLK